MTRRELSTSDCYGEASTLPLPYYHNYYCYNYYYTATTDSYLYASGVDHRTAQRALCWLLNICQVSPPEGSGASSGLRNCVTVRGDGFAVAPCVAMVVPVSVVAAIDASRMSPQVERDSSRVCLAGPGLSSRSRGDATVSSSGTVRPPSPTRRPSSRPSATLVPCESHASFRASFQERRKKEAVARALAHPLRSGTKRLPASSVAGVVVKSPRRGELHGEATPRTSGPCPRRCRTTSTNAVAVSGFGPLARAWPDDPEAASDARIDVALAEFELLLAGLGPPPPRAADAAAPPPPRLRGLGLMETLLKDMEACGVARGAPVA